MILTRQETRTISKNLTVQFKRVVYQIQSNRPGYALRNAQVMVSENSNGDITIFYNQTPLAYTIYNKAPRQAEVADTKTLNHKIKSPWSPPPDHPWRRYGQRLNSHSIPKGSPDGAD
jgi:hypothetical protein